MRDKLTKIVAVSVALVMAASCVAIGIAGHSTNNESFDDSLPTGNLTAVPYHRMPINAVGWNLIGRYSLEQALLSEESVVGTPLNVTPKNSLTSIYRYNSSTGLFEKSDHLDNWGWWPATGSESFTNLEPGKGYWVMSKNDCVWGHKA